MDTFSKLRPPNTVRIKVKLVDNLADNLQNDSIVSNTSSCKLKNAKKFGVDPLQTSYEVLANMITKEFNLIDQFKMSYLNNETEEYVSLNNDWDLDAAFFNSANPYLNIKVELINNENNNSNSKYSPSKPIDFETNKNKSSVAVPPSTPILSASLTKTTSPELYEEWDVISSNDLQMKQLLKQNNNNNKINSPIFPNVNVIQDYHQNQGPEANSIHKSDSFKRSKTYNEINTTNQNTNTQGKSLISIWSNQYVSVLHRMFNISNNNSNNKTKSNSLNSSSSNSSVSINNGNISITNDTNSINSINLNQQNQQQNIFIESLNQIENMIKLKQTLCETEYKNFLDSDGRVVQMQELKQRIYEGGIDSAKRKDIWPLLLDIYPNPSMMTSLQRQQYVKDKSLEYEKLKQKLWYNRHKTLFLLLSKSSNHFLSDNSCDYNNSSTTSSDLLTNESTIYSLANNIFRDVYRTDRYLSFYSGNSNKNIESLFNILLTYSLMNYSKVVYAQEMSDLLSPLLYVLRDEALAYLCFCSLMKRCKSNFDVTSDSFRLKMKLIGTLMYKYDQEFWTYLHMDEETDLSFVYRWLLIECKREFSFNDSLKVLEVMWSTLNMSQFDNEESSNQDNSTNNNQKVDLINGFNSYNYDYLTFGRSSSNASSISSRLLKQIGTTNNNCFIDYFNDENLISNDEDDEIINEKSQIKKQADVEQVNMIDKDSNFLNQNEENDENCVYKKEEKEEEDCETDSTMSEDDDIINFFNYKRKFNYFNFNRPRQGRFRCLSLNSASFYNNPNFEYDENESESERENNDDSISSQNTCNAPRHLFLQMKEQQLQEKQLQNIRFRRSSYRKNSLAFDYSTQTINTNKTNRKTYKKLISKFNHLFNNSNNHNYLLTKKNKSILNSIRHDRLCKNFKLNKQKSLSVSCFQCISKSNSPKNACKMHSSHSDLINTEKNVNFQKSDKKNKKLISTAKPIWMKKMQNYNSKPRTGSISSSANARFVSLNDHIKNHKNQNEIKKDTFLIKKIFSTLGSKNNKNSNKRKKLKSFSSNACSSPKVCEKEETKKEQEVTIKKLEKQESNASSNKDYQKSVSPTNNIIDKTTSNSSSSNSSSSASAFISNTSILSSSISSSCSTPFYTKPSNLTSQKSQHHTPIIPIQSTNSIIRASSSDHDYYNNDDDEKLIYDLSKTDNTFLLFICMAIFIENRDYIMRNNIIGNDVTCYFDKMKRKQNAKNILNKARYLYNKLYLSKANVFNYIQHVMDIQNSP